MMKKLVCFLLTCLLLCSAVVLPASAQEQQPDEAALLQTFSNYLDSVDVGHLTSAGDQVKIKCYSNDWIIFWGSSGLVVPGSTSQDIGGYIFFSMNCYVPYDLGLYAEKDGTVLTLKEAYEAGEIDIDHVVNSGTFNAYLAGDANTDGVVNVSDVLMVQKVIANEIDGSIGPFDPYARLCDYDGDGETTLKDVLALQKYVAKVA
ncbi:MAG: dockerin type I repeat-containing protein [Acutalibacteraceae bacterium]|nr:dockerin type I repeat-containing protein [Acutalibacteraceae bacterium]